MSNPFEFIEIVKDYPVISDSSYHTIIVNAQEEQNNYIPRIKIKFVVDSSNFRIERGYLELVDRQEKELKEYKVDEGNSIFYNSKKQVAAFLVLNTTFSIGDTPIEDLQKEMHSVLGATKDKYLLQAYRLLSLYWSIIDCGLNVSHQAMLDIEDEDNQPAIPPWEED